MDCLHLDWEGYSDIDLTRCGLDQYSAHRSTELTLAAYRFNRGSLQQWDRYGDGERLPAELVDALEDPHVTKVAFNAQFERVMALRVGKVDTPVKGWRCVLALALMQGFVGTLEQITERMGVPADERKAGEGKRLIRKFAMPQKPTALQPLTRLDADTDPADWELFRSYNRQDVVAEAGIWDRLIKYPIPKDEWDLYEIDQIINDRGLPIDMQFVVHAIEFSDRRRAELLELMRDLTGLSNPNSTAQLLPWLIDRGYPFGDLKKNSVKKVLTETEVEGPEGTYFLYGYKLEAECIEALKLRQNAASISVRKYNAIVRRIGADDRLRFVFQFAGAARTQRWAARSFQPHNLPQTPKDIAPNKKSYGDLLLDTATDIIRGGDYELLKMFAPEPMKVLVGCIRSCVRAPEGYELVTDDLKSIETCMIGWLARCDKLLNVFRSGLDPYISFCIEMYHIAYSEVTSQQRQDMKPAMLGCGFRLGGGDLVDGKRTGLWGYAEAMGVNLTREQAHAAVKKYRETYPEVCQLWYDLENAAISCVLTGRSITVGYLTFEMRKPYLLMRLPIHRDGDPRYLYYYKPRVAMVTMTSPRTGEQYRKQQLSYMAKQQNGNDWIRVATHGGKLTENPVQAAARDVLKYGMMRAHGAGFNLVGHVHDELTAEQRVGENYFTNELLRDMMRYEIPGSDGLPLDAAGYTKQYWRKE